MISAVTVKVSAAHPNAPLGPFYVIMGSAISLTIVDVPRSLGKREITGVVVKAKNADGEERGIAAERVGSAWGATVPDDFFDRVGTISNGIEIDAVGRDETGAEETWVLGSGQLLVLDSTGVITPEEKRNIVKWYTSQPANPVNGDACSIDGVPCIYTRGQWRPFGGGGGDMKHSEFSDLEAPKNMTQKQSNALLARIVSRLKGPALLLLSACCLSSLAALSPDTDHGDVLPTNKLGEVVAAAGATLTNDFVTATNDLASSVSRLESSKADKSDTFTKSESSADATAKANAAIAAAGLNYAVKTNSEGWIWLDDVNGSYINAGRIGKYAVGLLNFPWNEDYGNFPEDDIALRSQIEAATNGLVSASNPAFSNAVLAVAVSSLSTNITAEVYIAATNACANLGIDPALIPQGGTLGTVGGLLVALAAAVALLRKKTKLLKSDGTAEDNFATDLLGKQVAKEAIRANSAQLALDDDGEIIVTMNTED